MPLNDDGVARPAATHLERTDDRLSIRTVATAPPSSPVPTRQSTASSPTTVLVRWTASN
ncbi:hypothetical protein ACFQL0_04035 [Haloplanus litoreus]|uniref:hypothetical protein n=1 Tax=Haloplanus litoreus TaxID=767515 RepID=UPI003619E340